MICVMGEKSNSEDDFIKRIEAFRKRNLGGRKSDTKPKTLIYIKLRADEASLW